MHPSVTKLIQTGDIHLGASRSLEGYLERHRSILYQIIDIAYNKGYPLLITGDLTHSKTTTHEESYLLHLWLSEIEKRKIPTVIIAGNHDHIYGEMTQLDELKCMPFEHIKIITWHPDIHIIHDLGIICIPWRGYTSENIKQIVNEKLPLISHCTYKVVMLHECVTGVSTDNGFIMTKGITLPSIPSITYWALGDIHKFQRVNLANAYYSGSPAQFAFDDTLPKGVIEVDLMHPSAQPTLIPLTFKPLKVISHVEEITDDAYYKLIGGYEEVIKANRENLVVATEYDRKKESAIEYVKTGILEGLADFLAKKSIDESYQKKAIDWVSKLLKLEATNA